MSYMFIVVIGAVAGWVAGQNIKGSEAGIGIDVIAGAVGACVFTVLSRMVGPAGVSGVVMSVIIAVAGGVAALYGTRLYMRSKQPVVVARRPKARR